MDLLRHPFGGSVTQIGNARKCYPKYSLLSLMLVATVIAITLGLIRIEIEQWRSRPAISVANIFGGPAVDFEALDYVDWGSKYKIDDQVSDLDEVVVSNDEH